jgi:hypothetical protein
MDQSLSCFGPLESLEGGTRYNTLNFYDSEAQEYLGMSSWTEEEKNFLPVASNVCTLAAD